MHDVLLDGTGARDKLNDMAEVEQPLAVFVRFWLNTTPALPEPAVEAARAKAAERYEAFITALGRRLAKGPALRQEIAEDVAEENDGSRHSGER